MKKLERENAFKLQSKVRQVRGEREVRENKSSLKKKVSVSNLKGMSLRVKKS